MRNANICTTIANGNPYCKTTFKWNDFMLVEVIKARMISAETLKLQFMAWAGAKK